MFNKKYKQATTILEDEIARSYDRFLWYAVQAEQTKGTAAYERNMKNAREWHSRVSALNELKTRLINRIEF